MIDTCRWLGGEQQQEGDNEAHAGFLWLSQTRIASFFIHPRCCAKQRLFSGGFGRSPSTRRRKKSSLFDNDETLTAGVRTPCWPARRARLIVIVSVSSWDFWISPAVIASNAVNAGERGRSTTLRDNCLSLLVMAVCDVARRMTHRRCAGRPEQYFGSLRQVHRTVRNIRATHVLVSTPRQ